MPGVVQVDTSVVQVKKQVQMLRMEKEADVKLVFKQTMHLEIYHSCAFFRKESKVL